MSMSRTVKRWANLLGCEVDGLVPAEFALHPEDRCDNQTRYTTTDDQGRQRRICLTHIEIRRGR